MFNIADIVLHLLKSCYLIKSSNPHPSYLILLIEVLDMKLG